MKDELTALIFELQRAPSAADKAKVLARAWRTVRGLKPAERRLLAREVGFDGAEELVEGLSGKERGVLAPAAVLEALGKMRADPDLSVRRILADLRDPDRRDDLLVRGMDLVAESVAPESEPDLDVERFELPDGNVWMRQEEVSTEHDLALELKEEGVPVPSVRTADGDRVRRKAKPPRPPVPGSVARPKPQPDKIARPDPEPQPEPPSDLRPEPKRVPKPEPQQPPEPRPKPRPEPQPKPSSVPEEPSPWATFGAHDARDDSAAAVAVPSLMETLSMDRERGPREKGDGSAIERLRELRESISGLGSASVSELAGRLEAFPEPWARRRALVALLEAGVPHDPARALDLVADLERPMDRRWCLSALARRGDLTGDDLDRALSMLVSPAAKRRVVGLAAE